MKERRFVFGLLLIWAFVFGVKSWLGSESTPFKAFLFGLGDSLILVGVLDLIWNWVASRRTIHTRGALRRVVFGLLLGWALLDAVLSGLEAPRVLQSPAWVGVVVFFLSLSLCSLAELTTRFVQEQLAPDHRQSAEFYCTVKEEDDWGNMDSEAVVELHSKSSLTVADHIIEIHVIRDKS